MTTFGDKRVEAAPYALDRAESVSITWRYIAPAGHTLEMCRQPAYWRFGARELGQQLDRGRRSWNKIEVLAEDGSWEAELRVVSVIGNLVHTRLLRAWHAPAAGPQVDSAREEPARAPGRRPARAS